MRHEHRAPDGAGGRRRARARRAQVLTPLLQPEELHLVFGRIALLFSRALSEAFSRLDPLVRRPAPPRAARARLGRPQTRRQSTFRAGADACSEKGACAPAPRPARPPAPRRAAAGAGSRARATARRQGPAGEAQAAADLHQLLAALRALPLDPGAAASHLERLAALCRGRFAQAPAAAPAAAPTAAPASNGAARLSGAGPWSGGRDLGAIGASTRAPEPPTPRPGSSDGGGAAGGLGAGVAAPRAGSPTKATARAEHFASAAAAYAGAALLGGAAAGAPAGERAARGGAGAPGAGGGEGRRDAGARHADSGVAASAVMPRAPEASPGDDPLGAGAMFGSSPARPALAPPAAGPSAPSPGLPAQPPPGPSAPDSHAEPRPLADARAAGDGSAATEAASGARAYEGGRGSAAAGSSTTGGPAVDQEACAHAREDTAGDRAGGAAEGPATDAAAGQAPAPVREPTDEAADEDGGGGAPAARAASDTSELAYAAADPERARRGLRRFRPSVAGGAGAAGDADEGDLGPAPGSFCIPSADGGAPTAPAADPPAQAAPGRRRLFSEPAAGLASAGAWQDGAGPAESQTAGGACEGGARRSEPAGEPSSHTLPPGEAPRLSRRLTDVFARLEARHEAGAGSASNDGAAAWLEPDEPPERDPTGDAPLEAAAAAGSPGSAAASGFRPGDLGDPRERSCGDHAASPSHGPAEKERGGGGAADSVHACADGEPLEASPGTAPGAVHDTPEGGAGVSAGAGASDRTEGRQPALRGSWDLGS